ncbi:MAG: hypothetical protein QM682_04315 [Paracoccus sp. (in: a-proteobacteria)]|uniref:hypothetical protein n=1 Tax=Paracoccus sp. TaxID=267 RepID=UPI0039E23E1C
MTQSSYDLSIDSARIDTAVDGARRLCVSYHGNGAGELAQPVVATDLASLLSACQAVARRIFQQEFRMNSAVELSFALEDKNELKLWHTRPGLFIKCPLTMHMEWSCPHLSQAYKTMTTLGVVELPSEVALDGNAIGADETVKVIMDSMASGIEFMGGVMRMRDMIDHDGAARQARAAAGGEGA